MNKITVLAKVFQELTRFVNPAIKLGLLTVIPELFRERKSLSKRISLLSF